MISARLMAITLLCICTPVSAAEEPPGAFDASRFRSAAFWQDAAAVRDMAAHADRASKDRALIETIMRLCSPAFTLKRNHDGTLSAMMLEFGGDLLTGGGFDDESDRLKEPYVEIVQILLDHGANPNALRVSGWTLGSSTPVAGASGIAHSSGARMGFVVEASQGGVSALAIAEESRQERLIAMLRKAGAE